MDLRLNASHFLKFDQQLATGAPFQSVLDTLHNPTAWKVRADSTWSLRGWSATAALNFVNSYSYGPGSVIQGSIASWTTLDLGVRYAFDKSFANWLDGTSVSLTVTNALDRNPPYVNDQYLRLGYDAANANPIGRVLSLLVNKRW